MSLNVECGNCSRTYKVKDAHAGKRTRCPACNSFLVIPNARPRKQTTEKPDESCPGCSAPWEPGAILCLECGYHKEKREKLSAKVGRTIRFDPSIAVQQCSDRLLFTQSRLNDVSVKFMWLSFAFMLLGTASLFLLRWDDAFLQWGILLACQGGGVALVLGVAFACFGPKKQVEVLEVTHEILAVRNGRRWLSFSIPIDQVAQIFVRCRHTGGQDRSVVFGVFALTKQGRRHRLLETAELDSALRVEDIIEDFLGIEADEEVPKFAVPRTKLGIQGFLLIAVGVSFLISAPAKLKFDRDMEVGLGIGAIGLILLGYGGWKVHMALFENRELVEEELQGPSHLRN